MENFTSRYQFTTINGEQTTLPFIKLDEKSTDKKIVWKSASSRTDRLSDLYYGNPFHGYLILMANPEFGAMEYDIPDNTIIRIPYPFEATKKEYLSKLSEYKKFK